MFAQSGRWDMVITPFDVSLSEKGALSAIPTREGIVLSEQGRAKRAIVQWKLR